MLRDSNNDKQKYVKLSKSIINLINGKLRNEIEKHGDAVPSSSLLRICSQLDNKVDPLADYFIKTLGSPNISQPPTYNDPYENSYDNDDLYQDSYNDYSNNKKQRKKRKSITCINPENSIHLNRVIKLKKIMMYLVGFVYFIQFSLIGYSYYMLTSQRNVGLFDSFAFKYTIGNSLSSIVGTLIPVIFLFTIIHFVSKWIANKEEPISSDQSPKSKKVKLAVVVISIIVGVAFGLM